MFTPYLVVEQSPSAAIRCVYVASINDGTQILSFLEFTTIAIFRILDFMWEFDDYKILSCIDFYFQIDIVHS